MFLFSSLRKHVQVEQTMTQKQDGEKIEQFSLPKFMSAICFDAYGDPNVLHLKTDIAVPEVNSEQDVLVQVFYASVNPVDWKIRKGNLSLFFKPEFPFILGQDGSGVVVKSNSSKFKIGDSVFGLNPRGGTYAQYVIFKDKELAHKPDQMSYAEASCLPTAALTTHQALTERGKLEKGQRVLILGGAGGIGSYAVQYAKKVLGAEVYATCSPYNTDYLKGLGVDHVIDYNAGK